MVFSFHYSSMSILNATDGQESRQILDANFY